ncbi:unnamed protein product [Somion occarium]|uniref:F-box domain-containing protein n=1 Tax=Somion occarium TaxID=3059160 RepID=A0ABP1E2X2_9APHY
MPRKRAAISKDFPPVLSPAEKAYEAHISLLYSSTKTFDLLCLPVELFDIIISLFPDVLSIRPLKGTLLENEYGQRGRVLRALSRVSHAYRAVFLHKAWERLEAVVYDETRTSENWWMQLGRKLERVSNGLANTPEVARHVRIATVNLSKYSSKTVLPAFAHCLERLPNLHTLQVVHASSSVSAGIHSTFRDIKLPQIRNVSMPSSARGILSSCSEVRCVTCRDDDGGPLVWALRNACPKLEVLRGITPNATTANPALRKLEINARKTYFEPYSPQEWVETTIVTIRDLRNLRSLRTLIMWVDVEERSDLKYPSKRKIEAARQALRETAAPLPKLLVVRWCHTKGVVKEERINIE